MKKKPSNKFYLLDTIKNHWYFIQNQDFPSGVEMPSATTILEMFPNPGLDFWKTNTSPEEIKQKQEDGMIQGTKVHHCCYLLAHGQTINPDQGLIRKQIELLPLETSEDKRKDDKLLNYLLQPLTEREAKCLESFKNYWEEFKPITIGKELKVYHKKLRYAGTLDWVGYLFNKKLGHYELWIVDYKISKQHSRGYEGQNMCYYKALCEMYGKRFNARLGILYLGKSTKKMFQLKEVDDKKRAWEDFMISKKLWHLFNTTASPIMVKERETVSVDTSHKIKGRTIKLSKQH